MAVVASSSFHTRRSREWWVVAFTILVALPLLLGLIFMNQLYDWYSEVFIEPKIERSLGFRGGLTTIHRDGKSFEWYGVLSVIPGGAFDRAGIRAGDLPVGYQHGARTGLIADLQRARGGSVTLDFVNRHAYEAGNFQPRSVTVLVPKD